MRPNRKSALTSTGEDRKWSVPAAAVAKLGSSSRFTCEKFSAPLHTAVISVAFSSSGRLFVAGGTNGKSDVFVTETGEHVCRLVGTAGVTAVLLIEQQNGMCVACVGNFSGFIHVFAPIVLDSTKDTFQPPVSCTPQCQSSFGEGSAIHCMAASQDGTRIVAGGRFGEAILYAIALPTATGIPPSLDQLVRVRTSAGGINSLALSADGSVLVTGGESKIVEVWELSKGPSVSVSGAPLPAVAAQASRVDQFICDTQIHAIALSADATILAVGISTHTEVYRLSWSACSPRPEARADLGRTVYLSHASLHFLSTASLWRTSRSLHLPPAEPRVVHEPLLVLEEAPAQQGGVSLCARGETLAVGGKQLVHVYHVPSNATLRRLPREGRVRCVSLTREGDVLVCGGFDERVSMFRVEHGTRQLHCGDPETPGEVRSIHTVSGASVVVVGVDEAGHGGSVRLYGAHDAKGLAETGLKHIWKHDKAVWAVRLSSDAMLLFAAGYDGVATLYDPVSKARLLSIVHFSTRGPAFIWSLELSTDMSTLAVGCWSGKAHVYHLNLPRIRWRRATERLRQARGQPPLSGAGKTHSWSRTMAAALGFLKEGKAPSRKVEASKRPQSMLESVMRSALANGAEASETGMLTEVATIQRTDRVYSVAMSPTGSHLAVGGRDKLVAMYSLAGSAADGGWRAKPGGAAAPPSGGTPEIGELRCKWQAASDDFVYSVALSAGTQYCAFGGPEMLAVVLDGRSGSRLWSIACAGTVWSLAMLDDTVSPKLVVGGDFSEVHVVDLPTHRVDLLLPVQDVVNSVCITRDCVAFSSGSHALLYGQSGPHFGWRDQPSFAYITQTLGTLSSDEQRLAFVGLLLEQHPAITNARAPVHSQTLLQEVVRRGWADNSVLLRRLIQSTYSLSSVERVGLQADRHGQNPIAVALAYRKIHPLRVMLKAIASTRGIRASPACMECVSRSLRTLASRHPALFLDFIKELPLEDEPEVFEDAAGASPHDVHLPRRVAKGSEHRCPKGIWRDVLLEARQRQALEQEQLDGFETLAEESTLETSFVGSRLSGFRSSKDSRASSFGTLAERERSRGAPPAAGFPRVVRSGMRAVRVPIESFAGRLVCDDGSRTTVLDLVVQAVTITKDYSVFDTRSVSMLLDFKWEGYARRAFLWQLLFFSLHLMWTTAFTLQASQKLDDSLAPGSITFHEHWFFLVGWLQTTLVSLYYLRACLQRARAAGLYWYVQDAQEMINLLYNLFQVVVNALFWLRDYTPFFVFAPEDEEITDDPSYLALAETSSLREKEAQDRGVALGMYVTLQSFVMLMLYLRVLFFFRGFRGFGSLMNIVIETTWVALPFLVLIGVVTAGFGLATHLLLQHTIFGADPNYLDPMQTVNTIWNAGFRFIPPKPEPMRSRWQIILLYVLFMVFVQGILINLLVAMMAGTFARLRANAQLVAMYEHAKLVLELEPVSTRPSAAPSTAHQRHTVSDSSINSRAESSGGGRGWWPLRRRRVRRSEAYFPRWLHVLLPATNEEVGWEDEKSAKVQEQLKDDRLHRRLDQIEGVLQGLADPEGKANGSSADVKSYVFLQKLSKKRQIRSSISR